MKNNSRCRFCDTPLCHTFVDLGMSPLSNAFLKKEKLNKMEPFYPLQAHVCKKCFLVQLAEFESPENIFNDYAYFSSYSSSFLKHAKDYSDTVIERFNYNADSFIVELASNDGYLLKNFVEKNIPVLGIEPAKNVAKVAKENGVPTLSSFFGEKCAKKLWDEGKQADLIVGNNVLAHVPDLNDFVQGMKILLKSDGVITMEFPHLQQLILNNQFDTIYHEHFSYFSFITVEKVFAQHGLKLFDVDEIATHGGSLRIYGKHVNDKSKPITQSVKDIRKREEKAGFNELSTYLAFNEKVKNTKQNILDFFIQAKKANKNVAGYGAPAKGNTLLNYCGIRSDFIDYTVDRNPYKQGRYLPGTHIPIHSPQKLSETKPNYIVILPWNLKDEIIKQIAYAREWGCKFVTLIPEVRVMDEQQSKINQATQAV